MKSARELLGLLDAEVAQIGGGRPVPPEPRHVVLRRHLRAVAARQHPVVAGARPQAAVRKGLAERSHHGPRAPERELVDRQPVGRDPARRQPAPRELEVLARIEARDPGGVGWRRLRRDQVVRRARDVEKEARVLDAHAHARVRERIGHAGALDEPAQAQDRARQVHDVDLRQAGGLHERLGRVAEPVAHDERPLRARVERERPVDGQLHVAPRVEERAGHRVRVGQELLVDGRAAPVELQQDRGLGLAFADGHDVGLVARHGVDQAAQEAARHQAKREQQHHERAHAGRGDRHGPRDPGAPGQHEQRERDVEHGEREERGFDAEPGQQQQSRDRSAQARADRVGQGEPAGRGGVTRQLLPQCRADEREHDSGHECRRQNRAWPRARASASLRFPRSGGPGRSRSRSRWSRPPRAAPRAAAHGWLRAFASTRLRPAGFRGRCRRAPRRSIRARARWVPKTKSWRKRNQTTSSPSSSAPPKSAAASRRHPPPRHARLVAVRDDARLRRHHDAVAPIEQKPEGRGRELERRGARRRRREPDARHEQRLGRERAQHATDGVPAVESPQRDAERRVAGECADDERQRRAHHRGGQGQERKRHGCPRGADQQRLVDEARERRREPRRERRQRQRQEKREHRRRGLEAGEQHERPGHAAARAAPRGRCRARAPP